MSDAFDYIKTRDTADRLITKFGRAVQIRKDVLTGPDYDPVLTPTYFDTIAVRIAFTWKQIQSGNVLASDQRWLVAAGPLAVQGVVEVKPPDFLRVGGVDLSIVPTDPLDPAGTVVMFDCQVRV